VTGDPLQLVFVFVLAGFVGFQLISRVPPVLHTPLMSATNAIHGIVLVGAVVAAATARGPLQMDIAAAATFLGAANVVGGFVVTDRMLEMFHTGPGAARENHHG
jgi:NAD(P) transhydrogenase subunit alpha